MEESSEYNSGIPITEKPVIFDQLSNDAYPLNAFENQTQEQIHNPEKPKKEIMWSQVDSARTELMNDLDTYYSSLPEESRPPGHYIDMVKIAALGPLALDKEIFADRAEGAYLHTKYKEKSARAQALVAHTIFAASLSTVDNEECGNIYDMVAIIDNIANSNIGEAQGYKQWWNGVKSLLSVMRALHGQQYEVILPDYTQDPENTPRNKNHMLQFDVFKGVDLITQDKEGNVFLVDCKGESKIKNTSLKRMESSVITKKVDIEEYDKFAHVLKRSIQALKPASIKRALIIVPTSFDVLPRLRMTDGFENGRMELAAFSRLPATESLKIADELYKSTSQK